MDGELQQEAAAFTTELEKEKMRQRVTEQLRLLGRSKLFLLTAAVQTVFTIGLVYHGTVLFINDFLAVLFGYALLYCAAQVFLALGLWTVFFTLKQKTDETIRTTGFRFLFIGILLEIPIFARMLFYVVEGCCTVIANVYSGIAALTFAAFQASLLFALPFFAGRLIRQMQKTAKSGSPVANVSRLFSAVCWFCASDAIVFVGLLYPLLVPHCRERFLSLEGDFSDFYGSFQFDLQKANAAIAFYPKNLSKRL